MFWILVERLNQIIALGIYLLYVYTEQNIIKIP